MVIYKKMLMDQKFGDYKGEDLETHVMIILIYSNLFFVCSEQTKE